MDEDDLEHMLLGQRLAQVREARGYSQTEVAAAYGKPQSWLGKIEAGSRRLLYQEGTFLADFYHVSPDYFLIGLFDTRLDDDEEDEDEDPLGILQDWSGRRLQG